MVAWAFDQALTMLSPLPARLAHVQGVGARARWVSAAFDEPDRTDLIAAAYLHDIGYAPALRVTGAHQLDGARYVRACGHERLAGLVAHHSAARFEVRRRGLGHELREFPREDSVVADALIYCDFTTGPSGEPVSFTERIIEVRSRYNPKSIEIAALEQSEPHLSAAVARTEHRLHRLGLLTR